MVDKDTVRHGYDEISETYTEQRSVPEREASVLEQFVASVSDADCLLDAGCGGYSPVFARLPPETEAIGVDLSREQVRSAAQAHPEAATLQGDLAALPLATGAVGTATALHSLIHVPEDQHLTAIEELARVLRPGGRVLLSEGPERWEGTNPEWLDTQAAMEWTILGAEPTREQLRAAGFRIVEEWTTLDDLADEEAEWVFFEAERR